MVSPITVNQSIVTVSELESVFGERVKQIHSDMANGTSTGAEFLGWRNLPEEALENQLEDVLAVADKVKENSRNSCCHRRRRFIFRSKSCSRRTFSLF